MAEICSNDVGDDADVGGGDGKRKVDCEDEGDDDDSSVIWGLLAQMGSSFF